MAEATTLFFGSYKELTAEAGCSILDQSTDCAILGQGRIILAHFVNEPLSGRFCLILLL